MSLLDKTNLLITATAVKAGKLYSVIPASALGDCTVVRNTTATRLNSLGLIENVAVNTPRLNYSAVGGTPFLLDEPQRTNLIFPSNNNRNIPSAFIQGTYVANTLINSPDGSNSAYKFTPNSLGQTLAGATSSSNNRLFFDIASINTIFTNSIFVKSASGNNFNFAIKIVNSSSDTEINSKTIVVTSDWQRVDVSGLTTGANTGIRFVIKSEQAINLFGFQTEQGNSVSSYIPAVSSAVTRNADVITVSPPAGTVKITTTFSDNTTQVVTSIPALFTVPEGLIKQVLMQNSL